MVRDAYDDNGPQGELVQVVMFMTMLTCMTINMRMTTWTPAMLNRGRITPKLTFSARNRAAHSPISNKLLSMRPDTFPPLRSLAQCLSLFLSLSLSLSLSVSFSISLNVSLRMYVYVYMDRYIYIYILCV